MGFKTAQPATTPAAPPAEPKSSWILKSEVVKIDDSLKVLLHTDAVGIVFGRFGRMDPQVWIMCRSNTTQIYFFYDEHISVTTVDATIRIDGDKPRTHRMAPVNSSDGFGLWTGREAIPFIKKLFGHDRLLVQVTPFSSASVTAEFDISGLEEEIKPLRQACGW